MKKVWSYLCFPWILASRIPFTMREAVCGVHIRALRRWCGELRPLAWRPQFTRDQKPSGSPRKMVPLGSSELQHGGRCVANQPCYFVQKICHSKTFYRINVAAINCQSLRQGTLFLFLCAFLPCIADCSRWVKYDGIPVRFAFNGKCYELRVPAAIEWTNG